MYFDGYGRMYKTWVVLYACSASRGFVLDVVKDQEAHAVMKSFCIFVLRRGSLDEIVFYFIYLFKTLFKINVYNS